MEALETIWITGFLLALLRGVWSGLWAYRINFVVGPAAKLIYAYHKKRLPHNMAVIRTEDDAERLFHMLRCK